MPNEPIFAKDKEFQAYLKTICGFRPKRNRLHTYRKAWAIPLLEPSLSENNERLSCLGETILRSSLCLFLYRKYLLSTSEQIQDLYQKVTHHAYLSRIAQRLKMDCYPQTDEKFLLLRDYINSDILMAFLGALYLDKGGDFTQKIILNYLLEQQTAFKEIAESTSNFKGKVMAWGQKNKSEIRYQISKELKYNNRNLYVVSLYVNNEWIANGCDTIIKNAEQHASIVACEQLSIPV